MSKVILFTHDDLDGAGCRVVFETAMYMVKSDNWKVIICSNNNVDEKVDEQLPGMELSDLIVFADICCSTEMLDNLKNKVYPGKMFGNIMVFDHHLTNKYAEDILGNNAHIIHTNDEGVMESGTSLLYKFFRNKVNLEYAPDDHPIFGGFISGTSPRIELMNEFVDTVRSYDTYEWKTTNNMKAKHMQTLFGLLGMNIFCKEFVGLLTSGIGQIPNRNTLISDDQQVFIDAKLQNEQDFIDKFTDKDIIPIEVMGYNTALLIKSVPVNISELAYQFLNRYTEYDIFVYASLRDGGVFEIRTIRDDIDTGKEIAAPIGGGGHPKASGAPISEYIRNSFQTHLVSQLNQNAWILNPKPLDHI